MTNEATRDEQSSGELALGVPGSLSNRPVAVNPALAQADANAKPAQPGGAADNGARRNATTRQYAYDRNIVQIKHSRERLKRLNVAVVLSQAAAPNPKTGWSAAQLAEIDRVLRNGLGMDANRGDKLAVSTMPFPAKPVAVQWWEQRDNIVDVGGYLARALALVLVFVLVIRPLLKLLKHWLAPELAEYKLREIKASEPTLLAGASADVAQPVALEQAGGASAMPMVPLLENYDLPPAGSSVDVLVDHLKSLAGKEPERVAEVVKQWVQKNGRAS